MRLRTPTRAVLASGAAALALLGSCSAPTAAEVPLHELDASGEWRGTLDFAGAARADFRLALPADAVVARVEFECAEAALELHAQQGERIGALADAAWTIGSDEERKQFVLDHLGEDRVAGATWYFAADWPFEGLPRAAGGRVESAELVVRVETFRTRVDGALAPGTPSASALEDSSGGFRTFTVSVPPGAAALRLDLFDVTSDLDLYARRGGPVLALGGDVALTERNWGHETLVITPDSEPPLAPGEWYVDVVDAVGPQRALPFKLLATFEAQVPELLRELPPPPAPVGSGPLARALAAVVEIATDDGLGSGTLIAPEGWILTNAHVVGAAGASELVVSITLDPTLPARESFRARTVLVDEARDLALVKLESGLYGQPLPPGYALPTVELGDAAQLAIGDPLWLVGYPATGGTGSRVSISATRGVVSGFEREDFGVVLKTDAEITNGNSGGAALDERGRLVGLPSSTVENGSGQIGYVHPIGAVPRAWLERAGLLQPPTRSR